VLPFIAKIIKKQRFAHKIKSFVSGGIVTEKTIYNAQQKYWETRNGSTNFWKRMTMGSLRRHNAKYICLGAKALSRVNSWFSNIKKSTLYLCRLAMIWKRYMVLRKNQSEKRNATASDEKRIVNTVGVTIHTWAVFSP